MMIPVVVASRSSDSVDLEFHRDKAAFDAEQTVQLKFGDEAADYFEILSFETSAPVDDIKSATVTFGLSGIGAPSSSGS